MTVQRPLVSVIVPAYNASRTLEGTLNSAAAQTYPELEILIVDDGSTDATPEIARSFCDRDPRARLIRQANAGVTAARNTAIAAAKGEWIAPLDADDLWHPTKIERQVGAALAAPVLPGFVYCWFHVIDDANQVLGSSEAYYVRGYAVDRLLYFNFVGNGSSLLVNRAAAAAVGGYDPRFTKQAQGSEDLAFQLRIARDYWVEPVPEFLVGYRDSAEGISSNREQMHRSWQLALASFRAEGGPINQKCVRWNTAYRALRMADSLAGAGETRMAVREILRALWLDPSRTSAKLGHRLVRSIARRVVGQRPRPRPITFHESSPTSAVRSDPDEIRFLAHALMRWDRRRMDSLAPPEATKNAWEPLSPDKLRTAGVTSIISSLALDIS